jgi:hypothetical protein
MNRDKSEERYARKPQRLDGRELGKRGSARKARKLVDLTARRRFAEQRPQPSYWIGSVCATFATGAALRFA